MKKLKDLNELFLQIEEMIKKIKPSDRICLVHHDDTDGCCSAALFSILIHNITGDYPQLFPIIGLENVNRLLINRLKMANPDYVFVFDVTIDPRDLNIFKGFVLDHHIYNNIEQNADIPFFNPRSFEKDDTKVPPVSYMTYKILEKFYPNEKVAWIAATGITEDHRVDLCRDVFEKVKLETPELLKVENANQVIVAAEVTNKPSDRGQAEPMMKVVQANTGRMPRQMSADAGYFSKTAVENLTNQGIDVYMPPDKMRHASVTPPAPRGRIPDGISVADRMRRKLRTKKGRRGYALRKELPEPVFGQIKQGRGFRQFLLRGLEKVKGEWQLICTGHNLLKLFRAWQQGFIKGQGAWEDTLATETCTTGNPGHKNLLVLD